MYYILVDSCLRMADSCKIIFDISGRNYSTYYSALWSILALWFSIYSALPS